MKTLNPPPAITLLRLKFMQFRLYYPLTCILVTVLTSFKRIALVLFRILAVASFMTCSVRRRGLNLTKNRYFTLKTFFNYSVQ